jgi:hypothetical protein
MKKSKTPKQQTKTYRTVGIVFLIAGIIAVGFGEVGMFAAWLPIGAAFLAISYSEKEQK